MSADDPASWDEIERLADEFDRDEGITPDRDVQPSDAPVHVAAVPITDYSDQRRYRVGISNVDRHLGPLRPGCFMVVGARPGIGKTSLGEHITLANAADYRVMFATLEMTIEDIRDSLVAHTMGCTLDAVERAVRDGDTDYNDALEKLGTMNINLLRPRNRNKRTADALLKAALDDRSDILIVDYTRHIDGWEPGNKASEIVEKFANTTKDTGLCVVLLAQLRPEAHGARPNLTMFEDTGRLGQAAEKALLVYRPFLDDKSRDTIAEIIIAKNRRGRVNRCHVAWEGSMRSFYGMNEAEEAAAPCCLPKSRKNVAHDDNDDLGPTPFD